MEWSKFQQAIFSDVATGKGHTVVLARAGSGKTTVVIEALKHIPAGKSALLCAFNKEISTELTKRVQKSSVRNVTVSTLHSLGFRAIKMAFGNNVRLNNDKVRDRLAQLFPMPQYDAKIVQTRAAVKRVVSLAKAVNASTKEELFDLAVDFDLFDDVEGSDAGRREHEIIDTAMTMLAWCVETASTEIDFDDMPWLPVRMGLPVPKHDFVFVDETQDMNATQIELATMACAKNGRIFAIGDDRQAIYGFRGADESAIDNIVERLNAKVLPLSITYRCARKIAQEASVYVHDFECASDAKDGSVKTCTSDAMISQIGPGDFLLSRTNAPLIEHCLAFFQAGRRARIQGRDLGEALMKIADKSKATSLPVFREWLNKWEEKKVAAKKKRDPEANVDAIHDQAQCLRVISESAKSVEDMRVRCLALFSTKGGEDEIVLSTTHKAKGLERPRAFLLRDTYRTGTIAEENLLYVAITRAKEELVYVRDPK